ncbi:MAG TPA: hemerythrin domain-containing protein [Terriglobia bacterium]|nr:hemerythrin domain-containing protein [Terriglobia bacterium]
MTTMNPNQNPDRFQPYLFAHKALRALMLDTLTAVGRVDPGDEAEISGSLSQTRLLIDFCRGHLHHENQFAHPAMEARRPGSSGTTANDHVRHEESFERLEAAARTVEHASAPIERSRALLSLYRELALFVADNFEHMHVEETENTWILWDAYTDEELIAISHAITASIPREKMANFLRWMLPSLSAPERTALLADIRAGLPDAAFASVLRLAESVLRPGDWAKLESSLNLEAAGSFAAVS